MITLIGSGVVALTLAQQLTKLQKPFQIITANSGVDSNACSWWAGGMLAPFCEMESAPAQVGELAKISIPYWKDFCDSQALCDFHANGTLVISPNRDQNVLAHFSQKTQNWQKISSAQLHELEPALQKHNSALLFADEAHIEPRLVLRALWQTVTSSEYCKKVTTNTKLSDEEIQELSQTSDWLFDCRGYNAKNLNAKSFDTNSLVQNAEQMACSNNYQRYDDLRAVRGEMLHLYNPEITINRPIRLLHPRIPIYLVPRANNQFMLGATMIESNSKKSISVQSMLELLSALYAVNPAFTQSEIVETGVDLRPAYSDNLPYIYAKNNYISVNGMYRHGYLLAPAFAKIALDFVFNNTAHERIMAL